MKNNTNHQLLGYFLIPFIGILLFKFLSNIPSETFINISEENTFTTNTYLNNNTSGYINFNFDVKPILSDKCYTCHGPDEKARKAGLRLDLEQGFYSSIKDDVDKYIINRETPHESELIKRIYNDNVSEVMPPPESNLILTNNEKVTLKSWIEQGAKWEPHWSYSKPNLPEIPKTDFSNWCSNEIDFFISNKLESKGLKPSKAEEKEIVIRRLYFDLTGLPPSLNDINNFLKN